MPYNTGCAYLSAAGSIRGCRSEPHPEHRQHFDSVVHQGRHADRSHTSLKNFFAPLRPDYGVFDPKALYDQYANRFVVVALEAYAIRPAGDPCDMSRIMVAVSDDSDPNGTVVLPLDQQPW